MNYVEVVGDFIRGSSAGMTEMPTIKTGHLKTSTSTLLQKYLIHSSLSAMDSIVSQIQILAREAGPADKARLRSVLRQVLSDLGSPQDTLIQLYNGVSLVSEYLLPIRLSLFD